MAVQRLQKIQIQTIHGFTHIHLPVVVSKNSERQVFSKTQHFDRISRLHLSYRRRRRRLTAQGGDSYAQASPPLRGGSPRSEAASLSQSSFGSRIPGQRAGRPRLWWVRSSRRAAGGSSEALSVLGADFLLCHRRRRSSVLSIRRRAGKGREEKRGERKGREEKGPLRSQDRGAGEGPARPTLSRAQPR